MEDLLTQQQRIRFSEASYSHQNRTAENNTNKLVTMESTMLIHTVFRCPEYTFSNDIWPTDVFC